MENIAVTPKNYIYREVKFGATPVGTAVTRTFKLRNFSQRLLNYVATRSCDTNPIYYTFDIDKYEFSIAAGEEVNLTITYKPNLPGVKNIDYFKIIDEDYNLCKLCVKGECIGPKISCSVKYLDFFKSPEVQDLKKVFELKNHSTVPATYQFELDEDGMFVVNKLAGTLEPNKHIFVTVKFTIAKPGLYSKQLCCLIMHHEPILIHLFGVSSSTLHNKDSDFERYNFSIKETTGYSGYLSDSVFFKKIIPPVSFSENYLDFGRVLARNKCQTLPASLTNHLTTQVEVNWGETMGQTFSIQPQTVKIAPQSSALFECKFLPQDECALYATTATAQVHWQNKNKKVGVPIPISLRMIGHSFGKDQSWIPDVTILPKIVVVPLTLPNLAAKTTFMIKSHSYLPVMFKVLLPRKTNYGMKPMVGLIRDYQIIVVQLEPRSFQSSSYIETWNVEFNGQLERLLPIYIKGQTDLPSVVVGEKNLVIFENTQPGCQTLMFVPVKNTSGCSVQFRFLISSDTGIEIAPVISKLAPYEEMFTTWCYTGDLDGPRTIEVKCEAQAILIGETVTGPARESTIITANDCCYSELCAFPNKYERDNVRWGSTEKVQFHLFNFGKSVVFFHLFTGSEKDDDDDDIEMVPKREKCGPKEKVIVTIKFKVKETGRSCFDISYKTRLNEFSRQLTEASSVKVFSVEYKCLFPTLQIQEVVEHNFGRLFSKTQLWKRFNVDRINAILKEMEHGETKTITLKMPDCEMADQEYYVVFLLKNTTETEMSAVLKRRKLCDCQYKQIDEGFTRRKKIMECPHKELLTIEIADEMIKANTSVLFSFQIKYLLPDETTVSYTLTLDYDRCLEIDVIITATSNSLSLYSLESFINLGHVFIGLKDPPLEAFWLYNNTSKTLPYHLDDLEMVKLCNSEKFQVLQCVNGSGFVQPYSSLPILFKFWPITTKTYQIIVPLTLAGNSTELKLEGAGSDDPSHPSQTCNMPAISKHPSLRFPAILSTDHVVIGPIVTWSRTENLILIKNVTKSEISYFWEPCSIEGVVKFDIVNKIGMLQPMESHVVLINCISLSESCRLSLNLSCVLLNQTQLKLHQMSVIESQQKFELTNEEFTITEKGTFYPPEIQCKVISAPEPYTLTLSVDVNVIGVRDKDTCMPLQVQLRQTPCKNIEIDMANFIKQHAEDSINKIDKELKVDSPIIEMTMCQNVLQCLAADAVFSGFFFEVLQEIKAEPTPLYSQIKFSTQEGIDAGLGHLDKSLFKLRKEEIVKKLKKPQPTEMAKICKKVAMDSVHETFQLGPATKNL